MAMKTLFIIIISTLQFSAISQIQYEWTPSQFEDLVARGIAVGDIDNDGDLDISYDGYKFYYNTLSYTYHSYLYLNNGNAEFIQTSPFDVILGLTFMEDFDLDGDLDIIKIGHRPPSLARASKIYRNDGAGNYELILIYNFNLLDSIDGVTIDYDDDGDMDIFYHGVTGFNEGYSLLYENQGNFNFSLAQSLTGVWSGSIVKGDIDGDGDIDLIDSGVNPSLPPTKILRNNEGIFTEEPTQIKYGAEMALGDIDNDGDLDCYTFGSNNIQGDFSEIHLNNGNGVFNEIIELFIPNLLGGPKTIFTDANLDGYPDLYIAFEKHTLDNYTVLHKNNGTNFSSSMVNFDKIYSGEVVAYDFNNDGYEDIFHAGNLGGGYPFEVQKTNLYINTTGQLNVENNSNSEIKILIFPNPTHKILNIQTDPSISIANFTILNISGQEIFHSDKKEIDVSYLLSGIYFIKIETQQGTITKKFIKQ